MMDVPARHLQFEMALNGCGILRQSRSCQDLC